MWKQTYSKVFQNINSASIWNIWTDINNWHVWNPGIEYCKLEQPFSIGSYFILKPIGAPVVKLQLVEVEEERKFTDCTFLFGAKMYGQHELTEEENGIRLTTTMSIVGPLGFLWRKLLGEKIAAKIPAQTETLVELARQYGK